MIRLFVAAIILISSSVLSLAQTYRVDFGGCATEYKYRTVATEVIRDVASDSTPCRLENLIVLKNQNNLTILDGSGFHQGYSLAVLDAGYNHVGGRVRPNQFEPATSALAYSMLELSVASRYVIDTNVKMALHIESLNNIASRQVEQNREAKKSALEELQKLTEFIPGQVAGFDKAMKAKFKAVEQKNAKYAETLDELQKKYSVPPTYSNLDLPQHQSPGPIVGSMLGKSPTAPNLQDTITGLQANLSGLPPTKERDEGLFALKYADQLASTNTQLAEKLVERAYAMNFIASGALSSDLFLPDPLVSNFLGYQRKRVEYEQKARFLQDYIDTNGLGIDSKEVRANELAQGFNELAQTASISGNFFDSNELQNYALSALDIGLGFVPGVSAVKDFYELLWGKNIITNEELTALDRTFSAIGLLSGGIINSKAAKIITKRLFNSGTLLSPQTVSKIIDAGDKIVRQAGALGFESSNQALDLFSRGIGRAWAEARLTLNRLDGKVLTKWRAAPPNPKMVPKENLFARAMQRQHAEDFIAGKGKLAAPDNDYAFITAWSDIADHLEPEQLAQRLTLIDEETGKLVDTVSKEYVVLQFKFAENPWNSLSELTVPDFVAKIGGWLPGGETLGGAREFVLKNDIKPGELFDPDSFVIKELKK